MAEVPKEQRKLKRFRRKDLNTNLLQARGATADMLPHACPTAPPPPTACRLPPFSPAAGVP
jgi:hypothetical protein